MNDRHDEPMAYAVSCPPSDECDYRVFHYRAEAEVFDEHCRDSDDDADTRTQGVIELVPRESTKAPPGPFSAYRDEYGYATGIQDADGRFIVRLHTGASRNESEGGVDRLLSLLNTPKAPPGCVIDDTGAVRKVLGTLPVTKDGVIAMPGVELFHPQQDWSFHLEIMPLHPDTKPDPEFPLPEDCEYMAHYSYFESDTGFSTYESYDVRDCYSTRELAESARAKGGGE